MILRETIKIILVKKGLTMKELAERVGDSLSNLSNKLSRNTLKYTEAERIAEALEMRIEWIDKIDK